MEGMIFLIIQREGVHQPMLGVHTQAPVVWFVTIPYVDYIIPQNNPNVKEIMTPPLGEMPPYHARQDEYMVYYRNVFV
jgi:hypothetical protein